MSLQWTAVATFLYAEVFLVLLLCVPFVSPARWQKIFRSRLVGLAVAYGNRCFIVLIVILVLLLLDALRDSRRYELAPGAALQGHPGALEHLHMRRFRAQRNLYLAGFALLLAFLLRRLVALISQQALLGASSEAFRRQAEGASLAARRYLQDNDALRQQLQGSGGTEGSSTPSEENKTLRAKVEKLREELESSKRSLQKAEGELQAMRSQAEGLSREYDRLLEEHQRLGGAQADPKQKKLQ